MSIVLVGSTSGSITLQEPAVAGTTVLTLPAVTGTILTTTGQLIGNGTTTNDNASAGQVGEYVSATPSAYTVTTTVSNPTSISLTAGDWDVTVVTSGGGAGATATASRIGINTTASTMGNQSEDFLPFINDTVNGISAGMFTKRISLSATTTVYASQKTDAGTTVFQTCVLSARRRR